MKNETPEDKLKVTFRICDLNENGEMSLGEMTNLIEDIFKMPQAGDTNMKLAVIESTKNIFLKMDKNECLTEEKFVESCLRDDLLLKNILLQSRFLDYIAIRNKRTFQKSVGHPKEKSIDFDDVAIFYNY